MRMYVGRGETNRRNAENKAMMRQWRWKKVLSHKAHQPTSITGICVDRHLFQRFTPG